MGTVILKNLMEEIVEQRLDGIIDKLGVCKCEKCRKDIMCYALNHLPTKYVASEKGEVISRVNSLDSGFDMSVVAEISYAAQVVGNNPKH